ncbi:MAG: class I SAM-dependent methyltransferase, partial [Chloroflexi bacterium]|nr:class I SAM-dependent methyltransferase [Chloroflexota bacterium]
MPEPPLDALQRAIPNIRQLSELHDASIAHRKSHGKGCLVFPSPQAPVWGVIASILGAERVLEVGCGIGYQAASIASAAPDRRVETIENDPSHAGLAEAAFARLALSDRIIILRGDAESLLSELDGHYDLVVEDAGINYERWLPVLARLTRPGGVLIISNLSGRGRG